MSLEVGLILNPIFKNQIDNLKLSYHQLPFPAFITNTDFTQVWANKKAAKLSRTAGGITVAAKMLRAYVEPNIVLNHLKKQGEFILKGGSIPEGHIATFTPIYVGDDIMGVSIIITPNGEETPKNFTPGYQGHTVIEGQLRNSIDKIFSVSENIGAIGDIYNEQKLAPDINEIYQECYSMLRLLNNLSLYNELSRGLIIPDFVASNLSEWLKGIAPVIESLAELNDIEFKLVLPEPDVLLPLDQPIFREAFFNIIHNSLYYTKKGNTITVAVIEEKDTVVIEITDKGRGISQEEIVKVMDPYYSGTAVGYLAGAGLGLNIAQKVMELLRGTFSLESQLGEGTKVMFTLPKHNAMQRIVLSNKDNKEILGRNALVYVGLGSAVKTPFA